jgi:hypothetical protein
VAQDIVGSHASLSRIEKAAKRYFSDGTVYVGSAVYNDWTLASELHDAGYHVFSSSLGYYLAHKGRASKANEVQGQVVEFGRHVNTSQYDLETFVV